VTSLHDIFSLVCGQRHNWVVGGEELPFCQRCTGLYVGAVLAFPVFLSFRPKPTSRMLWVHGVLLLLMVPFGYHLVSQTGEMRMLTGQLFAIGLVYYLMLLPGDHWPKWHEPVLHTIPAYLVTTIAAVLLLQAAVFWGGAPTNTILSWVGFGGLSLYTILVLLNLALLATNVRGWLHRRASSSQS
jgi:uncharacterized membrane protein